MDLLNEVTISVGPPFEIGQAKIDGEANLIWLFAGRCSGTGIHILPRHEESLRADMPLEVVRSWLHKGTSHLGAGNGRGPDQNNGQRSGGSKLQGKRYRR